VAATATVATQSASSQTDAAAQQPSRLCSVFEDDVYWLISDLAIRQQQLQQQQQLQLLEAMRRTQLRQTQLLQQILGQQQGQPHPPKAVAAASVDHISVFGVSRDTSLLTPPSFAPDHLVLLEIRAVCVHAVNFIPLPWKQYHWLE
jgi:hypothetical protein